MVYPVDRSRQITINSGVIRHGQFILTAYSKPEDTAADSLTELLGSRARELIAQAVKAELQSLATNILM